MKVKEFVKIEKELQRELSDFKIKGSLMILPPLKSFMKGISFDGSDFDRTSFYVDVFIMPLCIPVDFIYFSLGFRVPVTGGDRWSADDPDVIPKLTTVLKRDAMPFLNRINSCQDAIGYIRDSAGSHLPRGLEKMAYLYALDGNVEMALRTLGELYESLDYFPPWHQEVRDQAKLLEEKLTDSAEAAIELLKGWEDETIRNLGLDKLV